MSRLLLRLAALAVLGVSLSGCLVMAAGAVVGGAVGVAGTAVGVTAKGVGMAAGAVIPGGDGDEDRKNDRKRRGDD
ncbi:hypothetical protein [Phenylobacterium sp.]|uniref:hypothetical protein n=1 Tax=Phenylobacterium sp. TaxID=1871053 RepID=UPI002FCBDB59